jgi:hypothetical protein
LPGTRCALIVHLSSLLGAEEAPLQSGRQSFARPLSQEREERWVGWLGKNVRIIGGTVNVYISSLRMANRGGVPPLYSTKAEYALLGLGFSRPRNVTTLAAASVSYNYFDCFV